MSVPSLPGSSSRLTSVQWLICIIASIGFAFDIYELLMLPLVVRPALLELVGSEAAREHRCSRCGWGGCSSSRPLPVASLACWVAT